MGYLSEFIALIERLRERAERHREYLSTNEAATRACLVDPVLRLLGWDVADPDQVRVEFRVEGNAVDYALLGAGKPSLLIEAKSLGAKLRDDFWQLAVYAARTGAGSGVMTNGDEWVFLDPNQTSSPVKAKLRLFSEDPRECALLVLEHLDAASKVPPPPPPPPPPSKLLSLPELEREIGKLGKGVPAPKLRSLLLTPNSPSISVSSYKALLREIAKAHADSILAKLPITRSDEAPRHYIAAQSAQHGTGARFGASDKLTGPGGREFYINVHGGARKLVRFAIRLLTVIGVDPDDVRVELA